MYRCAGLWPPLTVRVSGGDTVLAGSARGTRLAGRHKVPETPAAPSCRRMLWRCSSSMIGGGAATARRECHRQGEPQDFSPGRAGRVSLRAQVSSRRQESLHRHLHPPSRITGITSTAVARSPVGSPASYERLKSETIDSPAWLLAYAGPGCARKGVCNTHGQSTADTIPPARMPTWQLAHPATDSLGPDEAAASTARHGRWDWTAAFTCYAKFRQPVSSVLLGRGRIAPSMIPLTTPVCLPPSLSQISGSPSA
ncbi:unnamed protein product [Diplocarpon coronariae]